MANTLTIPEKLKGAGRGNYWIKVESVGTESGWEMAEVSVEGWGIYAYIPGRSRSLSNMQIAEIGKEIICPYNQ